LGDLIEPLCSDFEVSVNMYILTKQEDLLGLSSRDPLPIEEFLDEMKRIII